MTTTNHNAETFISLIKENVENLSNMVDKNKYDFKNTDPTSVEIKFVNGNHIYIENDGTYYDSFIYKIIIKIKYLKQTVKNDNNGFISDIVFEEILTIIDKITILFTKYYSWFESICPEHFQKYIHTCVNKNYKELCISLKLLLICLENKNLTEIDLSTENNSIKNNSPDLDTVFENILLCLKTHSVYENYNNVQINKCKTDVSANEIPKEENVKLSFSDTNNDIYAINSYMDCDDVSDISDISIDDENDMYTTYPVIKYNIDDKYSVFISDNDKIVIDIKTHCPIYICDEMIDDDEPIIYTKLAYNIKNALENKRIYIKLLLDSMINKMEYDRSYKELIDKLAFYNDTFTFDIGKNGLSKIMSVDGLLYRFKKIDVIPEKHIILSGTMKEMTSVFSVKFYTLLKTFKELNKSYNTIFNNILDKNSTHNTEIVYELNYKIAFIIILLKTMRTYLI